jgi:hypothetical protein
VRPILQQPVAVAEKLSDASNRHRWPSPCVVGDRLDGRGCGGAVAMRQRRMINALLLLASVLLVAAVVVGMV